MEYELVKKSLGFARLPIRKSRSFIRLRRVILLRSDIRLASSDICFASFKANKISLKPQGFNITIAVAIISLRRSRNITLAFSADLCCNGANQKPPLCKGRWQPKADGGIVKKPKIAGNNPSTADSLRELRWSCLRNSV